MRRIWIAFAGLNLGLIALFAASVGGSIDLADQHALGVAFTQLTGILSIGMMSFSMLLSARPRWLEPSLDGLDKMYRLHKWLGIGGLGVGILHWLTATGDGHGPAAAVASDAATTTQSWLQGLTGSAHGVGQPALFALIALVAIALIKLIPYRIFAKTHILTMLVFGVLAFHSIVLMQAAYWTTPIAWATAALIAIGVACGLYSLGHYAGLTRKTTGSVISSTYYPELRVLEADIKVADGWGGHRPGQFAFVTTDRREGAHPFTIATAWNPQDRRIGFIAKELGDHTARLKKHFATGQVATVEGPYGNFTFDDAKTRQIWVGAGIGITPFVARMRDLAAKPGDKVIDLFHATTDVSETALAKMRADAAAAGVTLHIMISPRDGRLDAAAIKAAIPDWKSASLWFCGPTGFGAALRRDFAAAGLAASDFHQELFEMR